MRKQMIINMMYIKDKVFIYLCSFSLFIFVHVLLYFTFYKK